MLPEAPDHSSQQDWAMQGVSPNCSSEALGILIEEAASLAVLSVFQSVDLLAAPTSLCVSCGRIALEIMIP